MLIKADILKTCKGFIRARLKRVSMGSLKARAVPIKPKSPMKIYSTAIALEPPGLTNM